MRDVYDCAYNGAGKREILERYGRLLKLMPLWLRRSFGNFCRHYASPFPSGLSLATVLRSKMALLCAEMTIPYSVRPQ